MKDSIKINVISEENHSLLSGCHIELLLPEVRVQVPVDTTMTTMGSTLQLGLNTLTYH